MRNQTVQHYIDNVSIVGRFVRKYLVPGAVIILIYLVTLLPTIIIMVMYPPNIITVPAVFLNFALASINLIAMISAVDKS